jgi:hypothetical protein
MSDFTEQRRKRLRERRKSRQFVSILFDGQEEVEELKQKREPDQATRIPLRVSVPRLAIGESASGTTITATQAILSYGADSEGWRGSWVPSYHPDREDSDQAVGSMAVGGSHVAGELAKTATSRMVAGGQRPESGDEDADGFGEGEFGSGPYSE